MISLESMQEEVLALYPLNKEYPDFTFTQMGHDSLLVSICMFAQERNNHKSANTYVYEFSHVMPGKDSAMYGAFHSSDMPYFWNIFSAMRERMTGQIKILRLEIACVKHWFISLIQAFRAVSGLRIMEM